MPVDVDTFAKHLAAAPVVAILRGVTPVRMNTPRDLSEFTSAVDRYLRESKRAETGDVCVLMAGQPLGLSGVTNSLAIHVVGDPKSGFARQEAGG